MKTKKEKGKAVIALSLALLLSAGTLFSTGIVSAAREQGESPLAISELKVNDLVSPIGIDRGPTFRWMDKAEGYGRAQQAYRILVSSTREKAQALDGDCWDSKKTNGEDNFDVAYAGEPLASKTAYYWRVMVWDEQGTPSEWSEIQSFETGILDPNEWTADWIGAKQATIPIQTDLQGASWIWLTNGGDTAQIPAETMCFRRSFTPDPDKTIRQAVVGFSSDDFGSFALNGRKAAEVLNVESAWETGAVADITELVTPGVNQIAVDITNAFAGFAGFVGKVELRYTDGTKDTIPTDSSWKLSKTPGEGWQDVEFDESGWQAPDMVIPYGTGVWGNRVQLPDSIDTGEELSAPMLRRSFELSKEVASARAYISGMGLFDLDINGEKPDDSVLNPAHTQYDKTVFYKAFDVTPLLREGKNAISVMLGNGFFNESTTPWLWQIASWRDEPKMIMELDIRYADGTSDTIRTDESWKSYDQGPMVYDSIYYGEIYDARKEVPGWREPDFDDADWRNARLASAPEGTLTFENIEPMRKLKTFQPTITQPKEGIYIVGIPEMTAGWAKFRFNAPEGTKITMHYGEQLLEDGTMKSTTNLDVYWKPLQLDTYICKGEPDETYEPRFNYDGYQYIQIEGYTGELTADDVECYMVHNDVEVISSLETGNPLVNKMHENMVRTILNNFHGKPTDTPLFEKNGWTGDNNVAMESVGYNIDISAFMRKYINDVQDAESAEGIVPDIVPTPGTFYGGAPVWSTVYSTGVQELYSKFGQESLVEDQYDGLRAMALYYKRVGSERDWTWVDTDHSDWCIPTGGGSPDTSITPENPEGSSLYGIAYIYAMFQNMAEFADLLNKPEDAAEYRAIIATIYDKFNEHYYNAEKQIYETGYFQNYGPHLTKYRQAANLAALGFGLVPAQYEEAVVKNLVQDIISKGYHLDVGIVGSKLILPMLSKYGYTNIAYKVLLQDTYPSWGYWANNGTSVWESWENTTRSKDHFFLGTYDEWLFKHMMGIQEVRDGYKTFTVKPEPSDEIGWADSSIQTMRGTLASSWKLSPEGSLELSVQVPVGATAAIYLPADDPAAVTMGGGPVTSDLPGVQSVQAQEGYLVVTAGSGSYSFLSRFDSNAKAHHNVVVENPDGIDAAAVINGVSYDLPVEKLIQGNELNIAIVSKDADYTFSHWGDNRFDLRNPAVLSLEEDVRLVPSFQYAARDAGSGRATLSLDAQPGAELSVNGTAVSLPYTGSFDRGTQLILDVKPPQGKYFAGWEGGVRGIPGILTLNQDVAATAILEDVPPEGNAALGKPVSSNDSISAAPSWGAVNLTDGNTTGTGYSTGQPEDDPDVSSHPKWVEIDLGSDRMINQAVLYPRTDADSFTQNCHYFPQDFTLSVKAEGEQEYRVVKTVTGHPDTSEPVAIDFDLVQARYVRLTATRLAVNKTAGDYHRLQLAEMEVRNTSSEQQVGVNKIELQADAACIGVGDALEIRALATPAFAHNRAVTWTVQEPGGALSDKAVLSIQGSEAALTGLTPGVVEVVARAADGRGAIAALRVEIQGAKEADKSILDRVIQAAQAAIESGEVGRAIESVRNSFYAAYENAAAVSESLDSDQQAVDQAWVTLMTELHKLGFIAGDKTLLLQHCDTYGALDLNLYLDGQEKDNFRAALANAVALLSDGDAMQNEITAADTALVAAANLLVAKGDKQMLQSLVERAAELTQDDYLPSLWAPFQTALDAADAVLQQDNASQQQIDQASDELLCTMLNLRCKADKSILHKLVNEAGGIELAGFSAQSVQRFDDAYRAAQQTLGDDSLTEDDQPAVDQAVFQLKAAIEQLVYTDGTPARLAVAGDGGIRQTGSSAKTGDAVPFAAPAAVVLLAGAAAVFSRKRRV